MFSSTGLFIDELNRELDRRRLDVPLLAHDLMAELEGRRSSCANSERDVERPLHGSGVC